MLVTINSSVNILIYCTFGNRFKTVFLQIFCGRKPHVQTVRTGLELRRSQMHADGISTAHLSSGNVGARGTSFGSNSNRLGPSTVTTTTFVSSTASASVLTSRPPHLECPLTAKVSLSATSTSSCSDEAAKIQPVLNGVVAVKSSINPEYSSGSSDSSPEDAALVDKDLDSVEKEVEALVTAKMKRSKSDHLGRCECNNGFNNHRIRQSTPKSP